jgi:sec-independent protein translocase protein TatC
MTITTVVGFGAVFELPLVTYFLARLGIVDHSLLIRFFRHAVVGIFLIAAIITPPDVFTQFLMAVPLTILYAISIGIAYLVTKKRPESGLALDASPSLEVTPSRV